MTPAQGIGTMRIINNKNGNEREMIKTSHVKISQNWQINVSPDRSRKSKITVKQNSSKGK